MTALFSCAAYKEYDKMVESYSQLEEIISEQLKDKTYGPISFLTTRFSILFFIGERPAEITNGHTVSLEVQVEDTSPAHLARALVKGLDDPKVPKDLFLDVKRVLQKEKWIN